MFSDEEANKPTRKLDEFANRRDVVTAHNEACDDALERRRNPIAAKLKRAEAFGARLPSAEIIPGLRDENDSVYFAGGRVSYSKTEELRKANREHNIRVRGEHAARLAAEAEAKSKGGGL